MKKTVIIALVIAAVCLVAGVAAIGVFIGLNSDQTIGDMFEKNVVESYEVATKEFAPDFERVSIIENEAEVELIRAVVGSPRIEYSKVEDRDYIVTVEDGILDIRVDDRRSSFLNFNVTFKRMFLRVYLPADAYDTLFIDSSSGSVTVPADFTFGEAAVEASSGSVNFEAAVTGSANIKTSSGSVRLANLCPETMDVETTSGSIKVTDAGAGEAKIMTTSGGATVTGGQYGDIEVGSSSGAIRVEKISADSAAVQASSGGVDLIECQVSGNAQVKTSSGTIEFVSCSAGTITAEASSGAITLERTVASGLAQLSNSSGGVTFNEFDAGELDVKTTSGSVKGTLLTGKMFDVRTGSGSENVPASDRDGGMCAIETGSGSVRITIAE